MRNPKRRSSVAQEVISGNFSASWIGYDDDDDDEYTLSS